MVLPTERSLPDAPGEDSSSHWELIEGSVTGVAHDAVGQVNQDCVISWSRPGGSLPVILAVSDGHGDAQHFRSDIGARLAVTSTVDVLREFVIDQPPLASAGTIRRAAMDYLPRRLLRGWMERVYAHLEANPLTEQELDRLRRLRGSGKQDLIQSQPSIAYGATLVALALTETYLLSIQLGDGDILVADATGQIRRPFPQTLRSASDTWEETDSLAGEDAWTNILVEVEPSDASPTSLLFVSTDGFRKAYQDEKGFQAALPDLVRLRRDRGLSPLKNDLPAILNAISQRSGDDVTMAFALFSPTIHDSRWLPRVEAASDNSLPGDLTAPLSEPIAATKDGGVVLVEQQEVSNPPLHSPLREQSPDDAQDTRAS